MKITCSCGTTFRIDNKIPTTIYENDLGDAIEKAKADGRALAEAEIARFVGKEADGTDYRTLPEIVGRICEQRDSFRAVLMAIAQHSTDNDSAKEACDVLDLWKV